MLVKASKDRDNTKKLVGHPIQLVIDTKTTEVMNNTKGMLIMDMLDDQDFIEDPDLDKPISYGFYKDFLTVASFLAIETNEKVITEDIFDGHLDNCDFIQNAQAYNSFMEAREVMAKNRLQVQLIGELNVPKEHLVSAKEKGVSTLIIKIIDSLDPDNSTVERTTNQRVVQETNTPEEMACIQQSFDEQKPDISEEWPRN